MARRLGMHADRSRREGYWTVCPAYQPGEERPEKLFGSASTEEVATWLLEQYLDRLAAGEDLGRPHPALVQSALEGMAQADE
jgi:hypothetical protein